MRLLRLFALAACLILILGGAEVDAAKKKKKKKKAKVDVDSLQCVTCRRMLGHLESSLADAFNDLDKQLARRKQAVEASGSEFASTSSSSANQIMMERGPAVDEALKAVCGATGLMRPELGVACRRLLDDHLEEFEETLKNHEKFGGRPGMAQHLCGPEVAAICPKDIDWDGKGFTVPPSISSDQFRSEDVPRSEDQPGFKSGIFKLVGRTVGDAIAEEGKDVMIHYRFPGSQFDDAYYKAWHDFGQLVHGTELAETVLLGEIDVGMNHLPAGPPVGGEYVEASCITLYPAQKKWSPTYILLHTDPQMEVKQRGADWFWQWLHTHGQRSTVLTVQRLAQERTLSGLAAPAKKTEATGIAKPKKKKKPKHKNEFAMTIPRERKSNPGVRPEGYDRDSILTKELVCSACMVVIDEIEYSLRKLKDVGVTVGRRLDSAGRGVSKRLNPGRNIVNVVDAMEHACDLTQEYGVSGTGVGQRWVRINARERGESILIESATVEAESPVKLTSSCSNFLEKFEDELEAALLKSDPDSSIQDEFCMYYVEECNGAMWDTSKRPSKLYPEGYDKVPDVVKEENFDDSLPLYGGYGAGAVTAGELGPDRQPSRLQLQGAAKEAAKAAIAGGEGRYSRDHGEAPTTEELMVLKEEKIVAETERSKAFKKSKSDGDEAYETARAETIRKAKAEAGVGHADL